ncbi:MAG TPA: hypothetical protein VN026_08570, partial [Bacteroidia bacterium]|nr:hypothetical protein [Bacteroidia bacterium]
MKKKIFLFAISLILGMNLNAQVTPVYPNLDFATTATGLSGTSATGVSSVIDRVTGHVYLAGYVTVSGQKDFAVFEFDSTGAQVNIATYDFASLNDKANSICISGGTVFVTGYSEAATGNADIITIAYNSS